MKRILSLGAGVQSSTLALMFKHGELTPMPDAAIFADPQAEPKRVYTWLDWLESQLPFPVYRVSRGSLRRSATRVRTTEDGKRTYIETAIPVFTVEGSTQGARAATLHSRFQGARDSKTGTQAARQACHPQ